MRKKIEELNQKLLIVYLAYQDPDTTFLPKYFALLTLCYGLSPIDLIPDFIPVLGYLDDLIILPLLICLSLRLIPEEVLKRCQVKAENLWKDGKPKSLKYAIPLLLIWGLLLYFIIAYFIV